MTCVKLAAEPWADAAIAALELATKLRPNSAAAWSNLGIAYNFREKYEQSVLCCYKAAQIRDTKVRVFKFKHRKHYKKTRGHRQYLTTVRVDGVSA